jgi:hypothetical protein
MPSPSPGVLYCLADQCRSDTRHNELYGSSWASGYDVREHPSLELAAGGLQRRRSYPHELDPWAFRGLRQNA